MSLVANFTIGNINTFPVEIVAPDNTVTPIASQGTATFFAFGTYTVKQSGAPAIYFKVVYPASRLLSTAVGTLNGNFHISAVRFVSLLVGRNMGLPRVVQF